MLPNIAYKKKVFPNISTSSFGFYPKLLAVLNINDDICTKFILRLKSRLIWIFQKKNYRGSKVLSTSMNLKYDSSGLCKYHSKAQLSEILCQ